MSCIYISSPICQVTMADRSGAERACKEPNPVIDGRKANVNLAYLGAKPRGIQPGLYNPDIYELDSSLNIIVNFCIA